MKSFKTYLLENRIDYLKQHTPVLSTEHDRLAIFDKPHEIIDHFANVADPSKNKQHTSWIVNQYKNKHIRQEDAGRIRSTLTDFDKYKSKLQNKDLNSYKHISDLEDHLEPHL